jgi:hypothetical protein
MQPHLDGRTKFTLHCSLGMGLDEKAIEASRRWRFETGHGCSSRSGKSVWKSQGDEQATGSSVCENKIAI